MPITKVYVCDGNDCSNTRSISNHWYLIKLGEGHFQSFPWSDSRVSSMSPDIRMACGMECSSKIYSQWMDNERKHKHNRVV